MDKPENLKTIDILLIEDNPGDVRLTQEALKEAKLKNNLYIVMDGEAALDFLFKKGEYKDAVTPDLILLDLNLPKVSGVEILQKVKNDEELKTIPIVVLTTSNAEKDILDTYKFHANCFIAKPVDVDSFFEVVKKLEDFWFTVVKLPPKKEHA